MQPILDEAPQRFPTFTGGELIAYTFISNSLGLGADSCVYEGQSFAGLRCEYVNTAAPLSGYQTAIVALSPPSGVSASDWASTTKQLNLELIDAEAVQLLYKDYNSFYNSLFINNEALLNQMISDAQITAQSGTQVSGRTIAIIEGVLYTAIEGAAGFETGGLATGIDAIGNIMETAVNAAVASGSVSETPFQTTVSNLWSQLSSDFLAIQTANGNNETSILEDWGRLKAIAALITSSGPDSLAWSTVDTADLVTALEPGFEITTMQMLLPALYSIIPAPQTNLVPQTPTGQNFYIFDQWTGDPPVSWAYFVEGLGNSTWNYFALYNFSKSDYPGQAAIQNDVFHNGVAPIQFFNNLSGWSFPLYWENVNTGGSFLAATGCNQLIVSVSNETADNLTLHLTENHGTLIGDTPRSLLPYSTDVVGFAGDAGHGPDFTFGVDGPDGSNEFEVQQDKCQFEAGNIAYTSVSNNTYQATNLSSTTGSYSDSVPGIDRVAVYNPDANQ
jgi:hypothetical protein